MEKFDRKAAERDFSEKVELYKTDPEEFERQSRAEIDRVIENAPPKYRDRLRGLQFQIDQKLKLCKDPVSRLNKMVELFWEGFGEFNKVLQGEFPKKKEAKSCDVVPIKNSKE